MINVTILEDEPSAAANLKAHIDRFGAENGRAFSVTVFDNAVSLLENYSAEADIVFMDIQMPMMNGMDAARKIRERDTDVVIVFVTNLAQYAIEGYEVGAYDFVLKPVRYDAFAMKMERLCRMIDHKADSDTLVFSGKGGMRRVGTGEITYIEVSNHDMTVHTENGEFRVRGSLSSMKAKLDEKHFVLCNSCYLVNLAYVKCVEGECVVVGRDRLRISQPKRKSFLGEVAKYLGGSV